MARKSFLCKNGVYECLGLFWAHQRYDLQARGQDAVMNVFSRLQTPQELPTRLPLGFSRVDRDYWG